MSNPQSTSSLDWRKTLASVLFLVGVGIIATSLVWPGKSSRRGAWSNAQAEQYQAASIKLHSLSHEAAHFGSDQSQKFDHDDLRKAQAEYDVLRAELDAALDRPRRLAWIFRGVGVFCVVSGWALLFVSSESARDDSTQFGRL